MHLLVLISDLILKELAESRLSSTEDRKIGPFLVKRVHNKGAFMNLGDSAPRFIRLISILIILLLLPAYIYACLSGSSSLLQLALSLILGGGFSNTCDRLKRKYVVDYLKCGKSDYYCNLGDIAIVLGAAILTIYSIKG